MERRRTAGDWGGKAAGALWSGLGLLLLVAGAAGLGQWANPLPAPAGAVAPLDGTQVFVRGLLNALPSLLLCLLTLALTRRTLLSLALAGLPMAALHGASALKLDVLDVPLIPADFTLLPQLLRGSDVLWHYAGELGVGPLALGGGLLGLLLLARFEPRLPLRHTARLGLGATALLGLASLGAGLAPWPQLYAPDWLDFWPWEPRRSVESAGLEASLLRYHWQLGLRPAAADAARVSAFLHGQGALPPVAEPAPGAAPADAPDIIVVQSESLFDPGRLRGIDSSALLPALHRLAAGGHAGDLWVPTFGGGTVRTEFEVLTGIALRYAPNLDYPYLQLSESGRRSLPQVLRSRGYATLAIHPNDGSFWNRTATFRAMGFERFLDGSAFATAQRRGYYVADEEINARILAALDEGSGPHFVFAVSIENHGPYGADQPNLDAHELASIDVPAGLAPEEAAALRVYLLHLRHADAALGELARALQARPRRSLLFFYGDHLPGLGTLYERLGFRDGLPAGQQPVPYVLVDSAAPPPRRQDLGTNFVPGWLLARAGIRDEPYFALAQLVRRATRFGPGYTPAYDAEFAEINRLRLQQGFCTLFVREPPTAGYRCDAVASLAGERDDGTPR